VKSLRLYTAIIYLITLIIVGCATVPKSSNIENAVVKAVNQAFSDIGKDNRIALVHIQTSNDDTKNYILGEITHILVSQKYNVVDRADIDRIRAERDFHFSGEVDDNTAVSLGKFAGADLVVTGGIDGSGSATRLRLKVIETQTTLIKGSASVPYIDNRQTDERKPPKPPKKVSLKIIGGGDMNSMSGLETDRRWLFGFHAGSSLDIKMGQTPILLEPGLRYITKGAKYELPLWGDVVTYEDLYAYLDIFAKVKWDIQSSDFLIVQPFVGYAGGILLSANSKVKTEDISANVDIKKSCSTFINTGLFGIDFIINDSLVIGGEYDIGFSNIWGKDFSPTKSDTILLNIGYRF